MKIIMKIIGAGLFNFPDNILRAMSGSNLYSLDIRERIRTLLLGIMIGKQYKISGMIIEIISDDGERWKTYNVTSNEIIYFDKSTLEKAIKLGKAEDITEDSSHKPQ